MGKYLVFGIALGAGIGAGVGSVGAGIAVGLAVALVLGAAQEKHTNRLANESNLIGAIGETSALLRSANVEYWPNWLDRVAERLRYGDRRAITELLAGYGGMGSFNDLYLSSRNGHRVTTAAESALNERFDALRSELYRRATSIAADSSSSA